MCYLLKLPTPKRCVEPYCETNLTEKPEMCKPKELPKGSLGSAAEIRITQPLSQVAPIQEL